MKNLRLTFNPTLDACIVCHQGATTFDITGFQTEVEDQLEVLGGYWHRLRV